MGEANLLNCRSWLSALVELYEELASTTTKYTTHASARTPVRLIENLKQWCISHPLFSFATAGACFVLLLYRNSLGAPFVYDDQDQIQTNLQLLSWGSVFTHYVAAAHPFSSAYHASTGSSYRPLFWLSVALDRRLFGLNVAGFHFTNLLLHWANGLLAFILLKRVGVSQITAAATALIWLALPINSEAVAWISGRTYCLLMLFVLLSLLFAEQYLLTGARSILLFYCVAHTGAVLSHEAGIMVLPFVFLISYSRTKLAKYHSLSLYVSGVLITVVYLCLRAANIGLSAGPSSWAILPVGATMAKYTRWILLPIHMSVERSTETPPNILSFANVSALFGVLLLMVGVVQLRNKVPEVSSGVAWTFLALLPFSGFIPIYQGMAERYAYLASIGLVLVLLASSLKVKGRAKYLILCLIGSWVLWGAWRLNSRVLDWRDEISLYASSLKTDPDSPVLLVNLGSTLADAGHLGDALVLIRRAVSLKPDYELAYRSLGNTCLRLGLFDEASSSYEKAITLQPDDVKAITNLGSTYVRLKDLDAAEREFRRAISLSPRTVGPHCDLGIVLFYQGKSEQALEQLQAAIKLNPADASPYYFLGFVEEQMGARQAAMQMYQRALELQPEFSQARVGLDRLQNHK